MNNVELTKRIFDCLSDGYDDEEHREETEILLCNSLFQLDKDDPTRIALTRLCETIEELQSQIGG